MKWMLARCGVFSIFLLGVSVLGSGVAHSGTSVKLLEGHEIKEILAGNSLAGRRAEHPSVKEYYRDDGLVLGAGYWARWRVDGDHICLEEGGAGYGSPDARDCYRLVQSKGEIHWLTLDGEADGRSQILPGNAFGF